MNLLLSFIVYIVSVNLFFSQHNFVEYKLTIHSDAEFREYLAFKNNDQVSYYFGFGGLNDHFSKTDSNNLLTYFDIKKLSSTRILRDGNLILEYKPLIKPYQFVNDSLPKMNWIINSNYKTIIGYSCQKATTKFRGRNYTAWFTKDISSENGPWKINGLPGLILEAYDDKGDFKYEAQSILLNSDQLIPIELVSYFQNKKDKTIDLKTGIELENKWLNSKRAEQMASYPVGTVFQNPPIRSEMKEITFDLEATVKP